MWPDGSRGSGRGGGNHRPSSRPGQSTRADGRHLSGDDHRNRSRSSERPREFHNCDEPGYPVRGHDKSSHDRDRSSGGHDQSSYGRIRPSHHGQSSLQHRHAGSPGNRAPISDDRHDDSEQVSERGWLSSSTGGGWGPAAPSDQRRQQRSGRKPGSPPPSRPRASGLSGAHPSDRSARDSQADGVGRRGSASSPHGGWHASASAQEASSRMSDRQEYPPSRRQYGEADRRLNQPAQASWNGGGGDGWRPASGMASRSGWGGSGWGGSAGGSWSKSEAPVSWPVDGPAPQPPASNREAPPPSISAKRPASSSGAPDGEAFSQRRRTDEASLQHPSGRSGSPGPERAQMEFAHPSSHVVMSRGQHHVGAGVHASHGTHPFGMQPQVPPMPVSASHGPLLPTELHRFHEITTLDTRTQPDLSQAENMSKILANQARDSARHHYEMLTIMSYDTTSYVRDVLSKYGNWCARIHAQARAGHFRP
jgi:hypothetical protein